MYRSRTGLVEESESHVVILLLGFLLQVHGPGNTILRKHSAGALLDVLELSSGLEHPFIDGDEGVVEVDEGSAELLNLGNCRLEAGENLQLGFDSRDLLGKDLLLALRKSDGHAGEVGVDGSEQTSDSVVALLEKVLPLLHVRESILKSVPLLD